MTVGTQRVAESNTAVTEVLRAARDLLSEPGAWIKGASARDRYGNETTPGTADAASWCSIGAIGHVMPNDKIGYEAAVVLRSLLDEGNIATFNDAPATTLDDVLDRFAKAIKHSEDPAS